MPIYEYRCAKCGETFDRLFASHQTMLKAKVTCPHCNSRRVRRLISAARVKSGDAASASDTSDAGEDLPTSSGLLGRKEIAEITKRRQKMGVG
ncbi:MAG: zinc ribbon domain-containing protein [Thermoflexales bacterium]|nr:zinc ribbon domain-containing protein [Thermoflexales bacterium]MDW8351441.1 zinc ribbon domain-containing protein [Anaerolineae bacterium]